MLESAYIASMPSVGSGSPSPAHGTQSLQVSKTYRSNERKFNVIVFGIKEQASGTPRYKRALEDVATVSACSLV